MAHDRLIGTEDGLPWDIPEEYNQYLRRVSGKTVIMGRQTYELVGRDLTSRYTIVVSSDFPPGNYVVCKDVDEALRQAESLGEDIFIAGGAKIYAQTINKADMMYLTYIEGEFKGVAYFPVFSEREWEVVDSEKYTDYTIVTYRRKQIY
ncbi:MAG: dihydrofolate reductase [Bacteroidia bacterium]